MDIWLSYSVEHGKIITNVDENYTNKLLLNAHIKTIMLDLINLTVSYCSIVNRYRRKIPML